MVTHGKGQNFMVFNNLAFFWTRFGFFLKRCLATLSERQCRYCSNCDGAEPNKVVVVGSTLFCKRTRQRST